MSFVSLTAIKKSDLLTELQLQARDIRFSALTTLLVRRARIILRLQVTHHCVCHYWDHSDEIILPPELGLNNNYT